MTVVQTDHFQSRLVTLFAEFPLMRIPVQMEIDFATSNPDLITSLLPSQADLRQVVIALPDGSSVALLVILRDHAITFFEARW